MTDARNSTLMDGALQIERLFELFVLITFQKTTLPRPSMFLYYDV